MKATLLRHMKPIPLLTWQPIFKLVEIRLLLLVGVVCCLPIMACNDDEPDGGRSAFDECKVSDDDSGTPVCQQGRVCAAGWCVPCKASIQCEVEYGHGYVCTDGECVNKWCSAGVPGCACLEDGTCQDEAFCVSGVCEQCVPGDKGCVCIMPGRVCNAGYSCDDDGVCVGIDDGELGGACQAGQDGGVACRVGECVAGVCVQCERGERDCSCYENSTCDQGLQCVEEPGMDGVCQPCPVGQDGCPCGAEGVCDGELTCQQEICLVDPCPVGTPGCPCADGDYCHSNLEEGDFHICSDGGVCIHCTPDIAGCPCDGEGQCSNNLICDVLSSMFGLLPGNVGEDGNGDGFGGEKDGKGNGEGEADAGSHDASHGESGLDVGSMAMNKAVDGVLTCRKPDSCTQIQCLEHQLCLEEPGQDAFCVEACEEGWYWDVVNHECIVPQFANCQPGHPNSILDECEQANRECQIGVGLVPAICGQCHDGFTDEMGVLESCRPTITCDDLQCDLRNMECMGAEEHHDAVCFSCMQGFVSVDGECVLPTCEIGAVGSIYDECEQKARHCVQEPEGPGWCGGCLPGFAENSSGSCVEMVTCQDLDCQGLLRTCLGEAPFQSCGGCITGGVVDPDNPQRCLKPLTCDDIACLPDEFCHPGRSLLEDAWCNSHPCDLDDQAYRADTGECVQCYVNCGQDGGGEAGLSGEVWPYTLTNSNRCICATTEGYFWDEGEDRGARMCDGDGDGWVRSTARDFVESADLALNINARCRVRHIDRFILQNEYGQRRQIQICGGAERFVPLDQGECQDGPLSLPLYETVRNDEQYELDLHQYAPEYVQGAGRGRRFRAEELNGLTRACVAMGDFNHNGMSDIAEWHGMAASGLGEAEAVFLQFGYMVELHRGWYEEGVALGLGAFVIAERSRCELNGFPLVYGGGAEAGMGTGDGEGAWWRQCARSRDTAFDGSQVGGTPNLGLDFARWSCNRQSGGCPVPPPPVNGSMGPYGVPVHSLCEAGRLPQDPECDQPDSLHICTDGGIWRGMSHHSQFRCVQVGDGAAGSGAGTADRPIVTRDQLLQGEWIWNSCGIACPEGDAQCAADCDGTACTQTTEAYKGASHPVIRCKAGSIPEKGKVGLVAASYSGYPRDGARYYQRGCINECNEWADLCPGYVPGKVNATCTGEPSAFGRLSCGCNALWAGSQCQVYCPESNLATSPMTYMPRTGHWLCSSPSSSEYVTEHGQAVLTGATLQDGIPMNVYTLIGEIPVLPAETLDEEQGAGDEYRIIPHGSAYEPHPQVDLPLLGGVVSPR